MIIGSCFFFFKQKTAYEMRISDWSSDVCSSDLRQPFHQYQHITKIIGFIGRTFRKSTSARPRQSTRAPRPWRGRGVAGLVGVAAASCQAFRWLREDRKSVV